jgi:hypothetical protein
MAMPAVPRTYRAAIQRRVVAGETIDDAIELTDQFISLYGELDDGGRRYVEGMTKMLAGDHENRVLAILQRHLAGERIADVYLDAETGEHVSLARGVPVPERHGANCGPVRCARRQPPDPLRTSRRCPEARRRGGAEALG